MIQYRIGTSGQILSIEDDVLIHFARHRQRRWWHREAGGQLFARLEPGVVRVIEATGPRRGDRRTRHSYVPDRQAEQAEIDVRHHSGIHFVGDWHTHPETVPRPSGLDLSSTSDSFIRSRHALNGFVLIVVGTAALPDGLSASVTDEGSTYSLICDAFRPVRRRLRII